jgi:hypothetical protein
MRKMLLLLTVVAAFAVPVSHADDIDGCQAVNPVIPSCEYISTDVGGILGVGDWKVIVHWSGSCDDEVEHAVNGWIRSSAAGGNNVVEPLVGAWAGTVFDAGYCVEAHALSPGSVVLVGHVGPIGQEDPPA